MKIAYSAAIQYGMTISRKCMSMHVKEGNTDSNMGIGGNIWGTWILHIIVIIRNSDNKGHHMKMIRNIFF